MSPKEKAAELLLKFMSIVPKIETAKKCALASCDEVLGYMGADRGYSFWIEVKEEIEKL